MFKIYEFWLPKYTSNQLSLWPGVAKKLTGLIIIDYHWLPLRTCTCKYSTYDTTESDQKLPQWSVLVCHIHLYRRKIILEEYTRCAMATGIVVQLSILKNHKYWTYGHNLAVLHYHRYMVLDYSYIVWQHTARCYNITDI